MKHNWKKWLHPLLFIAAGALVGLGYYYVVGCSSGTCPLTSSPWVTMAYAAVMGGLLSVIFDGGGRHSCNM